MRHDFAPLSRARRWSLGFGLGTPLVLAAIAGAPKDMGYAASSRLALTGAACAAATMGLVGAIACRRRSHALRRRWKVGHASSAVRDTLGYLQNEEQLARRGRLSLIAALMTTSSLHLLSFWPQCAPLAPFRGALIGAAAAALLLIPVLSLCKRGHAINAFFLRRYLGQQLDHLGFKSPGWRERRQAARDRKAPPVVVTGEGAFRAAGYTWRFSDFCTNTIVFGQTGSGKTVAVLNTLLQGLLASWSDPEHRISGLVLDAKGDFYGKLEALCARYGRSADLYILDPSRWSTEGATRRSIAWNPLDCNEDDALEIATRLIAALRLIGLQADGESFWLDSAKVYLTHAIVLVRAARLRNTPSLIDVYQLCLEGEDQTPLYHAIIRAIGHHYPDSVPTEIQDAIGYMEGEFSAMGAGQKSGLIGSVTQLLGEFMVEPFRDIFTAPSTIQLGDALDRGVILYINLPVADRERMSRLVSTLLKLEFQRNVLKRPRKTRPSFFLCDEFQTYYTTGQGRGDSDFFERSRESLHANIVAAQNIPSFLKHVKNEADVKNFLGNIATKIFLRNTDPETNRAASALAGQRSEVVVTMNEQAAFEGGWSRKRHTSYGRSTAMLPVVPQGVFPELLVPVRGNPDRTTAESVVHMASRDVEIRYLDWPINPLE